MAPYNDSPGTGTRNGSPAGRGTGVGALAGGALFVGLIGLCALVISYNGVFRLAEYGHPRGGLLVHVFPVTYTLLLLMACWTSYLMRDAPPGRRAWIDLVLIPLLVLFAAVVMVLNNLGLIEAIPQRVANVVVAVAPLLALLTALLLWMAVRAHLRSRRRSGGARPAPRSDRPTVLRARAVVHDEEPRTAEPDDGLSLEERLLGLGLGPTEAGPAKPEDGLPASPGTDAPRAGERPEPEPVVVPVTLSAAPAVPAAEEEDAQGKETERADREEPEASVRTLALPRRGQGAGNPIKQAAENPPLAPIAPEPESESVPEPDDGPEFEAGPAYGPEPVLAPEPVPTGPVDEGFEHDPLPGDPVTDEAEAPVREPKVHGAVGPAAAGEYAPAAASTPATSGEPDPEEPAPEEAAPDADGTRAAADAPPATGPLPPDEGDDPDEASAETPAFGISWEPPEDDGDTWTRAEYVPPVWTPPEDDEAPEPQEETAPALDHDTGPTVRAAFRIPDDPMAASRSALSDDLVDEGPVWSRSASAGRGGPWSADRFSPAAEGRGGDGGPVADGAGGPARTAVQRPADTAPDTARPAPASGSDSPQTVRPDSADDLPDVGGPDRTAHTHAQPAGHTPFSEPATAENADDDEPLWPEARRPGSPGAAPVPAAARPAETARHGDDHDAADAPYPRPAAEAAPAAAAERSERTRPAGEIPSRDAPATRADSAAAPAPEVSEPERPAAHTPATGRPEAAPEPEPERIRAEAAAPPADRPVSAGAPAAAAPADGPLPPVSPEGSGRIRRTGFAAPAVPPGAARPREVDDTDERPTEPLRRRRPLEKRPMVLKPPRPPMPDFAAGPPSRRVRSEPLRPEE
ncbi:hypothetical protein SAMN05421803_11662 [Nocardiopsis flavescens]|uniref:DUF2637 domain-containing protein n=1 Tax=Nocardiopsis flavescens TaxID=758803 RepID=A0A1M6QX39_9ACTN|nr:hypothetical protein [Nocardiopsis flavescens]SHK24710.1 hypothetical protein SAMN05421803_11662 [Nocardiopsis flavescens]